MHNIYILNVSGEECDDLVLKTEFHKWSPIKFIIFQ